ncbi:MlaE family ABC transporter permease [Desulfovibrio litoralis]|uniref:Phospholipid/cholesterol/gamma-HCH transport system permease protein n=1 Tax=Desulfovibrio litoralis DSM 11393 TaxID=1121455 RepID=A0A1M7RRJ5_9BACT|nr:ABC transporter permease [Desulfovibrio litoralis]SHN48905.1 phospholipid/cholesterol/gamma-HCH transport system permease protein [Desulfovibrio litoralis DSM 11393]
MKQASFKLNLDPSSNNAELLFFGDWRVLNLDTVNQELNSTLKNKGFVSLLKSKKKNKCLLNCTELNSLDTAGALIITLIKNKIQKSGIQTEFINTTQNQEQLFTLVNTKEEKQEKEQVSPLLVTLTKIGERVINECKTFVQVLAFLGLLVTKLIKELLQPWKLRWTSVFYHMEQAGVMAVPIVGLLSFLIGMVLSYMSADQLTRLGAQPFVINLLSVSLLRELGPMLTAIVVAGRSGSSYTAEIGAMVANQEIDAMLVSGFEPIRYLVIPRVLGLVITLPLLVFIANILGLLGGWFALKISFDMDLFSFVSRLQEVISTNSIWAGLLKTPVFALAVALIGCYQGFQSTGSADSVGKLTTKSVVESIFMVIVINAIFAIIYKNIGF